MRIELLCDNLLIGEVNYSKGDILEYEIDGARKEKMVRDGLAVVSEKQSAVVESPAAIPVKVEDKATIYIPAEAGALSERGPDELKVIASTPLNSDGKPKAKNP